MTVPIDPHRLPPTMTRARQIRSIAAGALAAVATVRDGCRDRGAAGLRRRRQARCGTRPDHRRPAGAARPVGADPARQAGRVPAPRRRQPRDGREAEATLADADREHGEGLQRCDRDVAGLEAEARPRRHRRRMAPRRLAARRRDHRQGDARPHRRAPRLHPPAGLHRRADRRSGPVHEPARADRLRQRTRARPRSRRGLPLLRQRQHHGRADGRGRHRQELRAAAPPRDLSARSASATRACPTRSKMPRGYMHGYDRNEQGEFEDQSKFINPALAWASGGIVSTPVDVNRFFRAYVGGDLFSKQDRPRPGRLRPRPLLARPARDGTTRRSRCSATGPAAGPSGATPAPTPATACSPPRAPTAAARSSSRSTRRSFPARARREVSGLIRKAQADAVCQALR